LLDYEIADCTVVRDLDEIPPDLKLGINDYGREVNKK